MPPKKKIVFGKSIEEQVDELENSVVFDDDEIQREEVEEVLKENSYEDELDELINDDELGAQELKNLEAEQGYFKGTKTDKNTQKILDTDPEKDTELSYFNFEENFEGYSTNADYNVVKNALNENYQRIFLSTIGLDKNTNSKDISVSDFKKGMKELIRKGSQTAVYGEDTEARNAPDSSSQRWLNSKADEYDKQNKKTTDFLNKQAEHVNSPIEKRHEALGTKYDPTLIINNPYDNQQSKYVTVDYKYSTYLASKEEAIAIGRGYLAETLARLTSNGNAHEAYYGMLNKKSLDKGICEFDANKINDMVNCISDEEIYQTYLDGWTPERMNQYIDDLSENLPATDDHKLFLNPTKVQSNSKGIEDALDAYAKLNMIRAERTAGWKFLNPVRNYRENSAVDRLKNTLMTLGVKEETLDQIAQDQRNAIQAHGNILNAEHYQEAFNQVQEKKNLENAVNKLPAVEGDRIKMAYNINPDDIKVGLETYAKLEIERKSHNFFYRITHADKFYGILDLKEKLEEKLNALGVDSDTIETYTEQALENSKAGLSIDYGQEETIDEAKKGYFEKAQAQRNEKKQNNPETQTWEEYKQEHGLQNNVREPIDAIEAEENVVETNPNEMIEDAPEEQLVAEQDGPNVNV